ncbi:hypothetical protein GALL_339940 [mine drainage metagenome]|uniref:Protein containing DUF167 n=1 Tax=mine drainage metagenome TaxID=410659 RepID=A0A1J5QWG3_9ZZZZ
MAEELWARIPIRVKPGASRARVGGAHGDRLVVAVSARAVDGKATEAALAAVADAFGARRRHVRLASGATSRDKVVEIACVDEARRQEVARELTERLTTAPGA